MPKPDESYYPETGDDNAPADETAPPEEKDSNPQSALVPKDILGPDAKVGDTCTFKVVHLYEDEAEIEYVKPDDTEPKKPDEMDGADDPFADDKMAAMGAK